MSKPEKQKEKAKSLEARDPKGAAEAWLQVLKEQDDEGDPNPDLSIYNRIGDLYLKLKDPHQASDFYDQAVDKYAELGFYNNAIAMCNKVLRNAPGRQNTYLKLAKLYAAKGFMGEAKQNFIDYAERMQKAGKIQQAFAALKEFAEISAESAHLRELLEEHLRMYGDPDRRSVTGVAAPAPPAKEDLSKSGKHKTSSLVFLDVDEPPVSKQMPAVRLTPPPRPTPPPAPQPEREPALDDAEPAVDGLIGTPDPEPDESLAIESTSLAEEVESPTAPRPAGTLEGLETTVAYGDVSLDPTSVPSLREEVSADDVGPMAELEPTVTEEASAAEAETAPEPLLDTDLGLGAAPPARRAPFVPKRPATPAAPARPGGDEARRGSVGRPPLPKFEPRRPEPQKVAPVVPKRPAVGPPPKRKTVVEVPPLELEADFTPTEGPDDEPLAVDEAGPGGASAAGIEIDKNARAAPPGRRRAAIDLGLDGVVNADDASGALMFAEIEETRDLTPIAELEARVADDPDDPEAHQRLGEALVETGARARGIEELDHATTGFENRGNLAHARELVDEILRLDPNSVRHRQKQVEFAFKSGDKAKLIDAYVELADTLLRSDLPDKARAVYQRVAEHDPGNAHATAALAMLAPVASPPPPEPKAKAKPAVRDAEGKTAPRDAKMKVRHDTAEAGDFVDLSAMMLEEQPPARDTRMKVADEEPTGDEEQDFQGMLARFKQGIDENIDEGDFQAHYDLGVAFKEMGLLDEAISELQKALRAPEGRLRSSEALGVCFVEKGAHVVAESILRRALELPASGDQERLGILYWLGRALEEQGKRAEARELYGRVFAVDVRFLDVGARSKALAKAK